MSEQMPQGFSPMQQAAPPPPMPKRSGVATVIGVLLLLLAVGVILNESLLKIREVKIEGNKLIDKQVVADAAGLSHTVSYFAVNEAKIAKGVESNRYLIYDHIEKQFPNRITLFVKERVPVVTVQEMGANYYLDAEGMVLERAPKDLDKLSEDEKKRLPDPDRMVIVTGLKPKDLRVGRMMTAGSTDHASVYRALLEELQLQGFLYQISELNITDPENLYLVTRDGYTAHLGGKSDLRPKIGTVRAVVAALRDMGKTGGMLEASIPEEIIYTPAVP